MITRTALQKAKEYAAQYPVLTVTGPRQSGKTTLCKTLFPDKPYMNLEDPDTRHFALSDPRGFLAQFPEGVILDEFQRVPDLPSYIQGIVDSHQQPGEFILTGSQQFHMMQTVSQSLAGRTALLTLLPFSYREIADYVSDWTLDRLLYTGLFPRIYDKQLNPRDALNFYVATYIERDVRTLSNVRDLSQFETFLKLCAGRTGQVLNLNALCNESGIDHHTAQRWLSLLETSGLIFLMPPYFANFNKRLTKSKKLYFLDTGLACNLLHIFSKDHLQSHPLKGAIFETFVVDELLKTRFNQGFPSNLYYYRENDRHEVDVILDHGQTLDIIEIKSGQTINRAFFKELTYFAKLSGKVKNQFLIYGGTQTRVQEGVQVLGWQMVDRVA